MSVNEDLVLTILRKIQEDLVAVKTDVSQLTNVEGLVVEDVQLTRALMQVVKQHGHRLTLEQREPPH